jgi:hypothetical protein
MFKKSPLSQPSKSQRRLSLNCFPEESNQSNAHMKRKVPACSSATAQTAAIAQNQIHLREPAVERDQRHPGARECNLILRLLDRPRSAAALALTIAAAMMFSAMAARAQDVEVNGFMTDVPAGGGVFDYTLTLENTGSEPVEGLWLGWALSSNPVFDIQSPTNAGNNLGWASDVDGNSVQYGGSSSETFLEPGESGTFTFDSTSTPAQFMSQTAGQSVAYGDDASQFAIEDNSLHSVEFAPAVVPEPSVAGLLPIGALIAAGWRRLRARSAARG